ncbi:PREDICTED: beta-arabinofuranosyltransferase RAY1 isoform X2 [Tarenaya hassleriana]|uniref:beta-arabinofuranosyltransferase RAY1 isoform X2 n=1 Tax=Tarenaya hassleriana TaxID=28532 RepID=UPI00053C7874|nr:PREDICTED: beta-arabinofuranosyltransferase RAY1 isoform X2 [Tarenaya hassleriana]
MKLKGLRAGLLSVWLSGFLLIALSFYGTHLLSSSLNDPIRDSGFSHDSSSPRITIFTAPPPFDGSLEDRQSLSVRSWLALSSHVTVVLFSQHPSVSSFAQRFDSRVLVDSSIDFTLLGTPFLHSMLKRSEAYVSDIAVLIDPDTILLPDFVSTLNYAYELDRDWLLVASPLNFPHFPFYLDEEDRCWRQANGRRVRIRELQKMINQNGQSNSGEGKIVMAWNNIGGPLHGGVIPPFLYQRGIHNQWVINEVLTCKDRFVFDASSTMSSFFVSNPENEYTGDNNSVSRKRNWEYVSNSHLGQLYGSLFFSDKSSTLPKLLKCNKRYLFVNASDLSIVPSMAEVKTYHLRERMSGWRTREKISACISRRNSRSVKFSSFQKDQPMPPLTFPFHLESLLLLVADKNKTVVLAVAGYSYKDMLMSWVCRLRRLAIPNFLVCALDEETYQFSVLQGLPVFADPLAPGNISFNDCHFGSRCFQRVTKVKSRIVAKILKLGYNVLLSDVDVYWFRNPLPLLQSFGPAVLVAQSDEYNRTAAINLPRRLNSGFYFARSDGPTIRAMEKVVKHAATSGLSEQPSFYDTLCGEGGSYRVGEDKCVEPETKLTVKFLDRDQFPNGAYLELWQRRDVRGECERRRCFVLHNNWISGRLKKLERQMMSGLWDYDSSTRMCVQSVAT